MTRNVSDVTPHDHHKLQYVITYHEWQELEDGVGGLRCLVLLWRLQDLLRDELRCDQSGGQYQVCNGIVPANGWCTILEWKEP